MRDSRMNPFSRFLSQWSKDRPFQDFVEHWDALEAIVVRVYREKMSPAEAEPEFQRLWPWLRQRYPHWEEALRPFWQQAKAGGKPTRTDPFRLLLAFQHPAEILGDWNAMQHLAAAREALNQFVISRSQ